MLAPSSEWSVKIQSMQLKELCAVILSQAITDQDKYQNGLTKIFFRAGMLAALEATRSARLNALVTLVQKNVRRRLAVSHYKRMRAAAIKIQTWWRGVAARKFVQGVRREASAVRIQKGIRRFIQRKKFMDVRKAVVMVQSRTYRLWDVLSLAAHIQC
jgi:myosin-5